MKPANLFGFLLKALALIATLGILVLSIGVFGYSVFEVVKVLKVIITQSASEEEIILKALKSVDLVLLGVVFFIMGIGLFELFVGAIDNLPPWLVIKDIDELKSMLIKVVIVVMGVSFTGKIVTWDGESDLLGYGLGLGAVIFALSFFLRVKGEKT
ncbi:MAG TPA: YqhA family protein [Saprospiraceae bacterium]|nr:YqhA family protein [Saprospiraceae bacterium]